MSDDLADLARDLYHAAEIAPDEAHKVVSKGALNIKNSWRDKWKADLAGGHLKNLWRTVGYDISDAAGDEILAVIGPDKNMERLQGALGGVAEFGTVNNAPASPAGLPALLKESDAFEEHLGAMGQRLLEGR